MAYWVNKIPGNQVPPHQFKDIRELFIKKFVKNHPRYLPFWHAFADESKVVKKEIFFKDEFCKLRWVYFMVGKGKEIYRSTPDEVGEFFLNQKPQEGFDIYLFDDDFNWCIVSTHELAMDAHNENDFLIYATGNIIK